MSLTYFVYFALLVSIYVFTWIGVRFSKDKMSIPIVLALALYTIVIGVRYSLGDDFQSYLSYYQSMNHGNEYDMYFESGFKYICRFFSFFDAPSYYMFSFFALLNVFAIFLFYKRNGYYLLLPFGFLFFFTNSFNCIVANR